MATNGWLQASVYKRLFTNEWLQADGYNRMVTTEWLITSEWLQASGSNRLITNDWLQGDGYRKVNIAPIALGASRAPRKREREREDINKLLLSLPHGRHSVGVNAYHAK